MDILQWAREHGADYGDSCCAAAERGDLELLKRLRTTGAQCGAKVCIAAAFGGWVHILMWAKTVGIALSPFLFVSAARGGQLVVAQYLYGQGLTPPPETLMAAARCCSHGTGRCGAAILRFAISCGVALPPGLCDIAVIKGCSYIISRLHSIGYPFDWAKIRKEAEVRGHLGVVEWMDEKTCKV